MSGFYLDTSALVKLYIAEQGSTWIRSLFEQQNLIFLAQISITELVSALNKRQRLEEMSLHDCHYAQRRFFKHCRQKKYLLLGINKPILIQSVKLLNRYSLRAYDAVQLATALESYLKAPALGIPTFVCSDNKLTAVAINEGMTVKNPTEEEDSLL